MTTAPLGAPAAAHRRPAHRRPARPRRRRAAQVVVLVLALLGAGVAAARLETPLPTAAATATVASRLIVPAAPVPLPWPSVGQAAVAVPALGVDLGSGPEQPVPIASLAKMMTAYVILRDHPLTAKAAGPSLAMTQADVDDFGQDTVHDEANVAVALGESLTERQLLLGLLVHSANNLADTLARWDAGSIPAFVDKMNAAAAGLDMAQSHFSDPSGFDPASQSTAVDLLKVAAADMANRTFASMVRRPSVTLPVAGTVSTYTPLLGLEGVVGVKSGYTDAAGGCDVMAVWRQVQGRKVMFLAATTGQTGPDVLTAAGLIGLHLVDHAAAAVGLTPAVRRGEVVGHLDVGGYRSPAVAGASVQVLSWPGTTVRRSVVMGAPVDAGTPKGTRVGSVVVMMGTQRLAVPVRLGRRLPRPSWTQRLF